MLVLDLASYTSMDVLIFFLFPSYKFVHLGVASAVGNRFQSYGKSCEINL